MTKEDYLKMACLIASGVLANPVMDPNKMSPEHRKRLVLNLAVELTEVAAKLGIATTEESR